MKKGSNRNSEGQALVLVLLALAVVLTIVLFVLSRSITDISVSSNEGEAASAFSAAEAGVEQALVIGVGGSSVVGSASYTSQVSNLAEGASSFKYPTDLNSGDSMTLWLKSQDTSADYTGSSLKICWGKPGAYTDQNLMPAIETVVFYETVVDTPSTARIYRAAFDPNAARRTENSFTAPGGSCVIGAETFQFQTTLDLSSLPNPQFAFIRMFYNTDTSHPVAFDSTDTHLFPTQGMLISSLGVAAQSSRKVEVFQSWPEIPSSFQFAVYSPTGLAK